MLVVTKDRLNSMRGEISKALALLQTTCMALHLME